jgi:putative ATP-dependent endonuclease of the OLD family
MQITYIDIKNFRGISNARLYFHGHSVIIGDNNAGKSTVFEAIDLVLGPDRLGRVPVVDEHDFFNGQYYVPEGTSPLIEIELFVTDLNDDQKDRFRFHLEFWNDLTRQLLGAGEIQETGQTHVHDGLRVKFVGKYSPEEDDFEGETFFCSPITENGTMQKFGKTDKRMCGFLYLRALRTGNRALSMERGSLLDIILRIRELRPKMWEDVLGQLRATSVATDPALGIRGILEGVQEALRSFVPADWGTEPILRVSDLTREHLRRTLTVFMSTGLNTYHAPFQHQGTGTINTMVLALLSMIAEERQSVIFAMEEPEIAIPPYTQKRIIDAIQRKASQALFTSHSPFVLEEFKPEKIILIRKDGAGTLDSRPVTFPPHVKPKSYSQEFRMRFCESLLAKKVLVCEGATEAAVYNAAARRLHEIDPDHYTSLEAMGVSVFDSGSDSSLHTYAQYFVDLGKKVFVVCDQQETAQRARIQASCPHVFESTYHGIEDQILAETNPVLLQGFYDDLNTTGQWPPHLAASRVPTPATSADYARALKEYLLWKKGIEGASWLMAIAATPTDLPLSITTTLLAIKNLVETPILTT